MFTAQRTWWIRMGVQLLCGMSLGVLGYCWLHLIHPGYVGDYYQTRLDAGYPCIWRDPVSELSLVATGPNAIWYGAISTVVFLLLQWKIRHLPFWLPVVMYSTLTSFAGIQTAYDVRAWSAHLR